MSFTDTDIRKGSEHESLGPEYFAAARIVERHMAKFRDDHFEPLIKSFVDQFREKLWDSVCDHMLSDTEMNMQSEVRGMVEGTIRALLTGEKWAMNRYPYCDYRDGDKIRKAIAEHSGDEIGRRRIADLEKELEKTKKDLSWARGNYG